MGLRNALEKDKHVVDEDDTEAVLCAAVTMRRVRPVVFLVPFTLLVLKGGCFELQDTIHELIEENIHLHDQLENLTQAIRELKRMFYHHSSDPSHHEHHDEDVQHLWDEWSQHGISADTHLLLENVFCGHELHGSAAPSLHEETTVLLLMFTCLVLLLISCVLETWT